MPRMMALFALAFLAAHTSHADTGKPKPADLPKVKRALSKVQDFIGLWKLEGTRKVKGRVEAWQEPITWGWKFAKDDVYLTVSFDEGKGKYFSSGVLRYDVPKKEYVFTLTHADKTERVFTGGLKFGKLVLLSEDEKTGDNHRLTLNTLAEGIRFQVRYELQEEGKGLFLDQFALNGNKDGESLGAKVNKPVCVVSGGEASMPVQYKGKTYYVCCSGCRDEFLANPEKYVN